MLSPILTGSVNAIPAQLLFNSAPITPCPAASIIRTDPDPETALGVLRARMFHPLYRYVQIIFRWPEALSHMLNANRSFNSCDRIAKLLCRSQRSFD
jgi:hypothetical protein